MILECHFCKADLFYAPEFSDKDKETHYFVLFVYRNLRRNSYRSVAFVVKWIHILIYAQFPWILYREDFFLKFKTYHLTQISLFQIQVQKYFISEFVQVHVDFKTGAPPRFVFLKMYLNNKRVRFKSALFSSTDKRNITVCIIYIYLYGHLDFSVVAIVAYPAFKWLSKICHYHVWFSFIFEIAIHLFI